jgi:hypothetical protein
MPLKSLTINGFKSFADKTKMILLVESLVSLDPTGVENRILQKPFVG